MMLTPLLTEPVKNTFQQRNCNILSITGWQTLRIFEEVSALVIGSCWHLIATAFSLKPTLETNSEKDVLLLHLKNGMKHLSAFTPIQYMLTFPTPDFGRKPIQFCLNHEPPIMVSSKKKKKIKLHLFMVFVITCRSTSVIPLSLETVCQSNVLKM